MKWNDLTNEAKNIIEWVKNPINDKKEIVEIQIGENFQRKVPFYVKNVDIPITHKLFSEIVRYVETDDNLETVDYDKKINKFVFTIK